MFNFFSKISLGYQFAFLGIILLVGFGSGWHLHGVYFKASQFDALSAEIKTRVDAEAVWAKAALNYESKIADYKADKAKRDKDIKNEIRKNPTYNSPVPVAGVRLANEAITASNKAAKSN